MAADGRFQRVRWRFPCSIGRARRRRRRFPAPRGPDLREPADGALMAAPARPSRASDPAASEPSSTLRRSSRAEQQGQRRRGARGRDGRRRPARRRPPRARRCVPWPAPARRCGRPGAPAPPGAARCRCARGSPGPPTWWPGRPGGDGAGPPLRQTAVALCHVQAPGGRWSRVPAPAGRSPCPGQHT